MRRERPRELPHERRDVLCGLAFVPAVIVVAGNVELHRFAAGFWIALAIALSAWLLAYRKWTPIAGLLAVSASRFALAFLLTQNLRALLASAVSAGLLIAILWKQRNAD